MVEPFCTSKMISDVVYEDQPTNHSDNNLCHHQHQERLFYNPEERSRRLQAQQYMTPKRMERSECPSTPIQELNGYIDRPFDHQQLRSKHT